MSLNLFTYTNYKKYLAEKLSTLSESERGVKSKVANCIGCQASYLSQILTGKPDLTLDQAFKLNSYFSHDKLESRYFILLVEIGRSTTMELKQFFMDQVKELQKIQFDMRNRLKDVEQISHESMNKYYSTWYYSAVHIALAIPEFNDSKALANHLNLPESYVAEVIQFLQDIGLIVKKNNEYVFTKMRIHIDRHSDFIQRHHINWRSQALQSAEKNLPDDLHFSSVFAISRTDFDQVKEIFVQAIEKARKIIRPSRSEELIAITLDLFKV